MKCLMYPYLFFFMFCGKDHAADDHERSQTGYPRPEGQYAGTQITRGGSSSSDEIQPTAPPIPGSSSSFVNPLENPETFVPGSTASTTREIQIELTISARNLIGKDLFSKSDPMCVIYIYPFDGSQWIEYGRTEVIWDNHDPEFVTKVKIPYRFEEQQPLKFEIYDIDSPSDDLARHDFLGSATCSLGRIVSNNGKLVLPLQLRNDSGQLIPIQSTIVIHAEEQRKGDDQVTLQLSGIKLKKKGCWGFTQSSAFIDIYKITEENEYVLVYRTEVIRNNSNPQWRRFTVPVITLTNGDYDRSLKFVCKHKNWDGSYNVIGEFETTLNEMNQGKKTFDMGVVHPTGEHKLKFKNSGQVHIDFFEILKVYSFMEYIMGGLQIHCVIAIDFTSSNGDPVFRHSLHYINSDQHILNHYEQAIMSVVSIIEDYDSDKQFPVLGFGATIPPYGRVSHEFHVNMAPEPFCAGVNGVLQAYRSCIRQVTLAGPTNFSPVIQYVVELAQRHEDGENYFIILILTDGIITDMQQTVRTIVRASRLPISIIIVGVGDANFKEMEELDADTEPLRDSDGTQMQRDIVQFVPFRKFLSRGNDQTVRARLAKEVLAEVPTQLVSYMRSRNFKPKPVRDFTLPVSFPPNPDDMED